jgi:hypothetical protein
VVTLKTTRETVARQCYSRAAEVVARECCERAADAARVAAEATDPRTRTAFLEIERRWLQLARRYGAEVGSGRTHAPFHGSFTRKASR